VFKERHDRQKKKKKQDPGTVTVLTGFLEAAHSAAARGKMFSGKEQSAGKGGKKERGREIASLARLMSSRLNGPNWEQT